MTTQPRSRSPPRSIGSSCSSPRDCSSSRRGSSTAPGPLPRARTRGSPRPTSWRPPRSCRSPRSPRSIGRPGNQPDSSPPPPAVALAFAGFVTAGRARASSLGGEAEQAREVQSGRAQIASMISHELKNPIMSIKGLASTGSRMYASMSDDERLEFFGLIDEEAGHLKALVDETATALKVDAGTLAYSFGRADVGELVREAAWKSPHGEHPLVVETEPGVTVSCDRLRLSEVIDHLLDNAAKFSPAEEPIEVRTYRSDGTAVIEVTDRGPGIPPERREDVFEKFARYRPRGYEELPGSGLGLYICRAHVIAHGGRISVEDPPGSGTMLRVTLPEERKEP